MKKPCVVFGQKIGFEGRGFAPETSVEVFASVGHYRGPEIIPSKTVRSNSEGEIAGFLKAPPLADTERGKSIWTQRAIFASGLNRGGKHKGQSFDLVVIGSRSICDALGSTPEL
jgi:hypothetical protein